MFRLQLNVSMMGDHSRGNNHQEKNIHLSNNMSQNRFHIHPIRRNFTNFQSNLRQPIEVGSFSLDGQRKYHDDRSQLRIYNPPCAMRGLSFNLRDGYDTYIEKDDEVQERLTHLLMWITKHKNVFQLKQQSAHQNAPPPPFSFNTDFVSWRGHLTKFLVTPFQLREPWKFGLCLFKGTIFISEIETEKAFCERHNRNAMQREMCYWGYKFEDYVTKCMDDDDNEDDGTSSPVNSNAAFCSVFRTRVQKKGHESYSLLAGAEVDCCTRSDAKTKPPPSNYVELKTSKLPSHHKQKRTFAQFKLLKFWAQSYLSGLPKVVVGFRDDSGVVREMKEYPTLRIPSVSEDGVHVEWDDELCLNFFSELLSWFKKTVVLEGPNTVYVVSFDDPFQHVGVSVVDDGSERFLPPWFTDQFP